MLSGFVIAFSVGERRITPGYVGRFALRRSLRLDPPYWGSLVLALGLGWLANRLFPARRPAPAGRRRRSSPTSLYLQGLLGFGPHRGRLLVALSRDPVLPAPRRSAWPWSSSASRAPAVRMARTVSLLRRLRRACDLVRGESGSGRGRRRSPGLFTSRWYLFFLGAMTWWAQAGTGPSPCTARPGWRSRRRRPIAGWHVATCVGLAASALIHVAHQRGFLTTGSEGAGGSTSAGSRTASTSSIRSSGGAPSRWASGGWDPTRRRPRARRSSWAASWSPSSRARCSTGCWNDPRCGLSRRVRLPRAPARRRVRDGDGRRGWARARAGDLYSRVDYRQGDRVGGPDPTARRRSCCDCSRTPRTLRARPRLRDGGARRVLRGGVRAPSASTARRA